ncbi:MAG: histidine phosphatase family protein, partial [Jatrophihabitans sp.]
MATVFLLRHGLTAMTGPVLAGRLPGVRLDERGRAQAATAAQRLAALPLAAVVTSPLERCAETAKAVLQAQRTAGRAPLSKTDRRLLECDYGDWTGKQIKALA